MNRVLVTASLIVKNEERFLGDCLSSLKGVADETVIVDTGSTDRTREIAREAGARVYEFPWNGSFSDARNRALDLSTGEWILYIDADERVRPESVANLRAELASPAHLGYEVLLHPHKGFTPYRILRLFRNYPSIRFRGVIHENMWPSIQEFQAVHGGKIGKSEMVMDHEGYEGNQKHKHERNLPLLLAGVQEDPGRIYSWCHLANIYRDLEQPELAEQSWRTALALVRSRRATVADDILPYIGLIGMGIDRREDVSDLLREAMSRFPNSPQLEWQMVRSLMEISQFAEAIVWIERLIARGHSKEYNDTLASDLRLFNQFAYEAVALCYFRMGRYAQSRQYYELASQSDPGKLEYRVKHALCSRLEAKSAAQLARG
jgi:glycosyltransferase involved in cell wall biosynthesis